MKKYNLYLWLTALVVLFASCSQDETDTLQTNESKRVSLTAELPDDFAQIGTRALPTVDGHKLRCILEVWAEGGTVLKHREEKINLNGNNVEFNFTIDAGTYNCLFWADFIAESPGDNAQIGDVIYTHYTDKYYKTDDATNGLKAISIIEEAYVAGFNTDARDAFFGNYKLTKKAEAIDNPEIDALTRPFAKLTIKEKDATNYGLCTGLTAKYKVPTTFNVMEGAAAGSYEASYSAAPAVGSSDYTLFSDYIFADANSTLGEVTLNFTGEGKTFQDVTIPAGIPLQRNFRTNASGNLITEKPAPTPQVKMTVTMDTNWGGEDVEEDLDIELAKEVLKLVEEGGTATDGTKRVFRIYTEAQLRAMHVLIAGNVEMSGTTDNKIYAHATYKLMNDINLNNVPWTPIGIAPSTTGNLLGIFDGQGHTISGLNVSTTEEYAGFFGGIGPNGVVKHLAVKGTVTGSGYVGGIASVNAGIIAYCSFEGDVTLTKSDMGDKIGGISGWNTKEITSCFANTTPEIPSSGSGGVSKGGIAGTAGTTVQGCTWYYNNNGGAGAGIEACYQGWTSGSDTDNKNASYFDNSGLNSRVSDMNSYNAAYNYQWEVANGTLILKKKE